MFLPKDNAHQRGVRSIAQRILSSEYESDENSTGTPHRSKPTSLQRSTATKNSKPTSPTICAGMSRWRLSGIVTNWLWDEPDADELIRWHRKRGGNSEKAHSILKLDLGAGQMPTDRFGANAAWWQIALIAFNLHVIMQTKVLGRDGSGQRLKAVRFSLSNVPGRVIRHARRLTIRVPKDHPSLPLIEHARRQLVNMITGPPGRWLHAA